MTARAGYAPEGTAYLLPRQPDPGSARIRLLCFHHAGGAASLFAGWQRAFHADDVAVVPVQLPGREHLSDHPAHRDAAELVAGLDAGLGPLLDLPHAFYGHSMGGLIAHALADHRHRRGARTPELLAVGAMSAPHLERPVAAVRGASDTELVQWMIEVGGVPDLVLRYPQWLAKAAALLRADLLLGGDSAGLARDSVPLPCPIHVLTGSRDPLLTPEGAAAWARYTTAGCRVHEMPGGHFFTREHSGAVTGLLSRLLAARPGKGVERP
ncbi:thioesterase II family protein [Streptomyces formicae]|uniref:Putative thioesterase n=1 Tax=Streptomyces formicae TaxID=1616117 RepID=A0A291Q3Y0_9ACTN|nr:thioesterase domain-containing protein [Streptomyces formicae]ATL26218.1 putative thioesterase [Streptomyces formicae]